MARKGELKRLTPQLRQRILDEIAAGRLSLRQISATLGVSRTTTRKLALQFFGMAEELRDPIWHSPTPQRCPTCGFKITTTKCVRCRAVEQMDDQAKLRYEADRWASDIARRKNGW